MSSRSGERPRLRVVFLGNGDWYLYNFRLPLARHLREALDAEVILACPDGPFRPAMEAAGFRYVEVPMARQGIHPAEEAQLVARLVRLFRELQPDVVHDFTVKPVVWGSLAARLAGVPVVVNALSGLGSVFHGRDAKSRFARLPLIGLLRLALASDRVHTIFQNPDDMARVRALAGVPAARTTLIESSGVDVDRFRPADPMPVDGPIRVVFVGRLLRDKGVFELCDAAASVAAVRSDVEFLLAGETDDGNPSSLRAADVARLSALTPSLRFLGHVDDIPALLRTASLAVLPSYGEGLPRAMIEAAATGLPLVSTDVPGCREVVRPGENGLLVPARDAARLAEAILALAADPPRRARFGSRSRAIAVEEYAEARVFERTAALYRRLLTSP